MNGFRFKRVKNKFRWESDFMVLEFSNPSIQGFSDYIQLQDQKEIMYYYYTVKLFKKVSEWDDHDKEFIKWRLVSKREVYDFPCIKELQWILDYFLTNNDITDCQKIEYQSGKVEYSKRMMTEGFACDDFYEITKFMDSNRQDERYVVYCGTTFDYQGDFSVGIRTPYVERKDVKELLSCVNEFIQYSIDMHNLEEKYATDRFKIMDKKLYEYEYRLDTGLNFNKIESIYSIGDKLEDITLVCDNLQSEYRDITITDITENGILLSNEQIINIENLAYLCNKVLDEKLKYDEEQVADEFINILNNIEKKKNLNQNQLINYLINIF